MKIALAVALLSMTFFSGKKPDRFTCLPDDIDRKAVIQEASPTKKNKPLTVEQKLTEIDAKCKKGKLVDRSGREIKLIHLLGCWGNPPADYLEQLENQRKEIERLKKNYTVIEIPCAQNRDPSKIN